MKPLLLIFTLFVASALAGGINGGGNGGGFAEMMTVLADQTMSDQIRACLSSGSSCELTARQAQYAGEFLGKLPALQKTPFRFSPECGSNPSIEVGNEAIVLPSCLLYETSSTVPAAALPARQLYLVALEARLRQAGEWGGEGFALLAPVFKSTLGEDEVSSIALPDAEVSLHAMKFEQSWYESTTYFSIETPVGTWDITERVVKAMTCGSSYRAQQWSARLLDGDEAAFRKLRFRGELTWKCGSYSLRAKMKILAPLDAELGLEAEDVSVSLTQIEPY